MVDHHEDDDFAPTQTAGYKPGEKKTMEEYRNLDAQDESLNKWKESLGLKDAGERVTAVSTTFPCLTLPGTI